MNLAGQASLCIRNVVLSWQQKSWQAPQKSPNTSAIIRGVAQVAKLVDALASGASDRKVMGVRVSSWAPSAFANFGEAKI